MQTPCDTCTLCGGGVSSPAENDRAVDSAITKNHADCLRGVIRAINNRGPALGAATRQGRLECMGVIRAAMLEVGDDFDADHVLYVSCMSGQEDAMELARAWGAHVSNPEVIWVCMQDNDRVEVANRLVRWGVISCERLFEISLATGNMTVARAMYSDNISEQVMENACESWTRSVIRMDFPAMELVMDFPAMVELVSEPREYRIAKLEAILAQLRTRLADLRSHETEWRPADFLVKCEKYTNLSTRGSALINWMKCRSLGAY